MKRDGAVIDGPEAHRVPGWTSPVIATELGEAKGGLAVSAAVAMILAASRAGGACAALLAELGPERDRAPTLLASGPARELEQSLGRIGFERVAARGRLCWVGLPATREALSDLSEALDDLPQPSIAIVHLPAALWPLALGEVPLRPRAGLLRADLHADRALAALAVFELRERGLPARIASRPLGWVASRRALAGLELGSGSGAARLARIARGLAVVERDVVGERGQALGLAIGAVFAILFVAAVLAALGGAVTGAARVQRAADLVALSGARSLRDDFPRLFAPRRLAGGTPNPRHLDRREYLARAEAAARSAAERNGVDPRRVQVSFPDARSFAPLRVRAEITASVDRDALPDPPGNKARASRPGRPIRIAATARAEASPAATAARPPAVASGGGYSGPLAYRQSKRMRPDVAAAFDRMAAAARRAGISLVINSAYRSDAEQARLFAAHPDPRWVAPPGTSLHRCATELDLGPPSAYGFLDAEARRFGFVRRYSWEPWHFGYTGGPPPCSERANAVTAAVPGGERQTTAGLPDFVPPRYRTPIERAAARWNVSAGVLAAQLMVESNFNPYAVSAAGARGIAQFMPATAAAYRLRDPFDAPAAIDAQAHLMSDLLRGFGSIPLALAAYNAGPGTVSACHCVPEIPETEAYVARILGLLGGAGEVAAPTLEVRLIG
ncbi:MAG TPA: transglycosylase SLT domain-containing protein [Solirubrobacterales bacterium]|nr:transglycosylase SLT domain-containing protein [Solirubrobacterales bacterium]